MPRKRPIKSPPPRSEPVVTPADEPTIGEVFGSLPVPPAPQPGFAVMADEPDQLADPTVVPGLNPGDAANPLRHVAPSPPYFDPQRAPDPNQGWGTSHPNELDPTPLPQQVEDDYRPGDNEPPPSERAPDPEPEQARDSDQLNRQRRAVYDAQRQRAGAGFSTSPLQSPTAPRREKVADDPASGEIMPPGKIRYESRISIVDAFRYPGNLTNAPAWVDRNWVGFGDYDAIRGIDEGPCLRVPSPADPNEVVLCRIGDYVCRQSVLLDNGRMPELRTEVWAAEQFERLFVGVAKGQPSQNIRGITGPGSNLGQGQRRTKPAA
jgi:hypothetical protein